MRPSVHERMGLRFPTAVGKRFRFPVPEAPRRKNYSNSPTPEAEFPGLVGAASTGTIGYPAFTLGVAVERSSTQLFRLETLLVTIRRPEYSLVKTV